MENDVKTSQSAKADQQRAGRGEKSCWRKFFIFFIHDFDFSFAHFRLFTAAVNVSTMQLNFHNEKPETFRKDYFSLISLRPLQSGPPPAGWKDFLISHFFPSCPFQCSLKSCWCIKKRERFFASFDHTKNFSIIPNKRRDFPIERMHHSFRP